MFVDTVISDLRMCTVFLMEVYCLFFLDTCNPSVRPSVRPLLTSFTVQSLKDFQVYDLTVLSAVALFSRHLFLTCQNNEIKCVPSLTFESV